MHKNLNNFLLAQLDLDGLKKAMSPDRQERRQNNQQFGGDRANRQQPQSSASPTNTNNNNNNNNENDDDQQNNNNNLNDTYRSTSTAGMSSRQHSLALRRERTDATGTHHSAGVASSPGPAHHLNASNSHSNYTSFRRNPSGGFSSAHNMGQAQGSASSAAPSQHGSFAFRNTHPSDHHQNQTGMTGPQNQPEVGGNSGTANPFMKGQQQQQQQPHQSKPKTTSSHHRDDDDDGQISGEHSSMILGRKNARNDQTTEHLEEVYDDDRSGPFQQQQQQKGGIVGARKDFSDLSEDGQGPSKPYDGGQRRPTLGPGATSTTTGTLPMVGSRSQSQKQTQNQQDEQKQIEGTENVESGAAARPRREQTEAFTTTTNNNNDKNKTAIYNQEISGIQSPENNNNNDSFMKTPQVLPVSTNQNHHHPNHPPHTMMISNNMMHSQQSSSTPQGSVMYMGVQPGDDNNDNQNQHNQTSYRGAPPSLNANDFQPAHNYQYYQQYSTAAGAMSSQLRQQSDDKTDDDGAKSASAIGTGSTPHRSHQDMLRYFQQHQQNNNKTDNATLGSDGKTPAGAGQNNLFQVPSMLSPGQISMTGYLNQYQQGLSPGSRQSSTQQLHQHQASQQRHAMRLSANNFVRSGSGSYNQSPSAVSIEHFQKDLDATAGAEYEIGEAILSAINDTVHDDDRHHHKHFSLKISPWRLSFPCPADALTFDYPRLLGNSYLLDRPLGHKKGSRAISQVASIKSLRETSNVSPAPSGGIRQVDSAGSLDLNDVSQTTHAYQNSPNWKDDKSSMGLGAAGHGSSSLNTSVARNTQGNPVARRRVAVIGAGLAGTIVARELMRTGLYDVDLYESSPRIGGRTYSQRALGVRIVKDPETGEEKKEYFPQLTCHEAGAMRIPAFNQSQPLKPGSGPWKGGPYHEGYEHNLGPRSAENPCPINSLFELYIQMYDLSTASFPDPGKAPGQTLQQMISRKATTILGETMSNTHHMMAGSRSQSFVADHRMRHSQNSFSATPNATSMMHQQQTSAASDHNIGNNTNNNNNKNPLSNDQVFSDGGQQQQQTTGIINVKPNYKDDFGDAHHIDGIHHISDTITNFAGISMSKDPDSSPSPSGAAAAIVVTRESKNNNNNEKYRLSECGIDSGSKDPDGVDSSGNNNTSSSGGQNMNNNSKTMSLAASPTSKNPSTGAVDEMLSMNNNNKNNNNNRPETIKLNKDMKHDSFFGEFTSSPTAATDKDKKSFVGKTPPASPDKDNNNKGNSKKKSSNDRAASEELGRTHTNPNLDLAYALENQLFSSEQGYEGVKTTIYVNDGWGVDLCSLFPADFPSEDDLPSKPFHYEWPADSPNILFPTNGMNPPVIWYHNGHPLPEMIVPKIVLNHCIPKVHPEQLDKYIPKSFGSPETNPHFDKDINAWAKGIDALRTTVYKWSIFSGIVLWAISNQHDQFLLDGLPIEKDEETWTTMRFDAGHDNWEHFWYTRMLPHYQNKSFSQVVTAAPVLPSEKTLDGRKWKCPPEWLEGNFGGLGVSQGEFLMLAVLGVGDGSWKPFYPLSSLWILRAILFGFANQHQLLVGKLNPTQTDVDEEKLDHVDKTPYGCKGRNLIVDSNGNLMHSPQYMGAASLAEMNIFSPLDVRDLKLNKSDRRSPSLYDLATGSKKNLTRHNKYGNFRIFANTRVEHLHRIGHSELQVTATTNFIQEDAASKKLKRPDETKTREYEDIVCTIPVWNTGMDMKLTGFKQAGVPLATRTACDSVHWIRAAKVFLPVSEAFWVTKKDIFATVSVTDTILQDSYCLLADIPDDQKKEGSDAHLKQGLFCMAYCWEDDAQKFLSHQEKDLVKKLIATVNEVWSNSGIDHKLEEFLVDPTLEVEGSYSVFRWSLDRNYHGCAKAYHCSSENLNALLLNFNNYFAKKSQLYFAGDSYGNESGWIETGACRLAIDAVLNLINNDPAADVEDFDDMFKFEEDYYIPPLLAAADAQKDLPLGPHLDFYGNRMTSEEAAMLMLRTGSANYNPAHNSNSDGGNNNVMKSKNSAAF